MWQKTLKPYVESGKVVAVGVVQEQHAERAQLYAQWRQLDWPIFVDSLNLLDLAVVPVPIALDAAGIVRHERVPPSKFIEEFVVKRYPPVEVPTRFNRAPEPDLDQLINAANREHCAKAWRNVGDAQFLFEGPAGLDRAVASYERAATLDSADGRTQFRLGVALRCRYESRYHRTGDSQAAVEHWGLALAINPNQYIWRRRIQQYGPRLDKPYNFYGWVTTAREQIQARGVKPVALSVEPMGSELAPPEQQPSGEPTVIPNPDAEGRIHRDRNKLVGIDTMVTPARVQPGHRVQARVTFRLNDKAKPFWNNEFEGLRIWVADREGVKFSGGTFHYAHPKQAETTEMRTLELEIQVDPSADSGRVELPGYALYDICEDEGGVCRHLRQDFKLVFEVDPKAPKIQ